MTQILCSNPGCELPAVIKFCSSSCAAKYNNSVSPKRKLVKTCKSCGTKIRTTQTYCSNCNGISYEQQTLGEYRSKRDRHAIAYNALRAASRNRFNKSSEPESCVVCGYDKHIELAHILELSKAPDETLIGDLISTKNTIPLCPNHHWEFDYGDLRSALLPGYDPSSLD